MIHSNMSLVNPPRQVCTHDEVLIRYQPSSLKAGSLRHDDCGAAWYNFRIFLNSLATLDTLNTLDSSPTAKSQAPVNDNKNNR